MERIICLAIGYVFGLFQTAYIYGKLHGIDIRDYGSGNAGTTNTLRVLGPKAGILVLLGDMLKCILAVVAAVLIFGSTHQDMIYLLKIYASAGAILGHNFPFYLHFKGGKGIAATAGMSVAFHPYFAPVCAVLFFGVFFTTHYVSLGSLVMCAGFFIEMVVMGQMGFFGMSQSYLIELYIVTALLTIMAYYRHRENIKRLLSGTERKTYLNNKNKESSEEGKNEEQGK